MKAPSNLASTYLRTTDTHHTSTSSITNDQTKLFRKYNINFQHVPPHSHRHNSAERAIQTWKNHLIVGITTYDTDLPPAKWDCLMPQCDITINILISYQRYPELSAHACLYRKFEFNRSPLDKPGTKVVIHETVDQRDSWDPHGIRGW